MTNAASFASAAIAPGEIVTIKGNGLGPAAGVQFSVDPSTGGIDSTLAGTRVLFGSYAAPILYASATQVNAIVPYEIAGQSQVTMQVSYQGSTSSAMTLQVSSAAPGVFTANSTGTGPRGCVESRMDRWNGPSNMAAKGSYVSLYFTGGGQTNPTGVTGAVNTLLLKNFNRQVTATIGGQPATVTFAGSAPSYVDGLGQLNIQLPANIPSGALPIVITVGGISSTATATLSVF